MSEKGYDSDAQCISTPKQTAPSMERFHTAVSFERDMSPLGKPYQTQGVCDTSGQLQKPRSEQDDITMNEQHEIIDLQSAMACPAYVRHSPQPLHSSPNISSCTTQRVPSPLANVTNLSSHGRNADTSRPVSISERLVNSAGIGHGLSAPSRPINGGHGRFYATVAQQGLEAAQASFVKSSESLAGKDSEIAIAKRRQQQSRGSSAEIRSIHLGDMNISKALVSSSTSTSTSPRILSQNASVDENGQMNRYSIRSLSDQYHDCVGQRSTNTPSWGQNELNGFDFGILHKRDASSFYSPKSSISSARIPTGYQFPGLTANASNLRGYARGPSGTENETGTENENAPTAPICNTPQQDADMSVAIDSNAVASEPEAQTDVLTSKFVEEFGISPPVGSPRSVSNEALPPRKISIGWMTGGRRLGYGYDLVPGNENENQKSPVDSNPAVDGENNGVPKERAENEDQDTDGQPAEQANTVSSALDEPPSSNCDLLGTMDSQTPRRWSGSTALVRATKSSGESTDRSSTASSFWEWLTTRRMDQHDHGEKTAERTPESRFSGSDKGQSPDTEQSTKTSFLFRNRYSELLDRGSGMRFRLDRRTDSATGDGTESVVQAESDMSQFGSLPKKRPRVKFRVLNRSKKHNNRCSTDSLPVFPVKRSLWMRNSGPPEIHSRLVDPGPGRYCSKHSKRFGPDGAEEDHDFLEMHSDPE